ncbi:MAG: Fic family protein [Actinomycetota bacterium]|nr:Fic family protein [Actinomycetota bacterium]
MWAGIRSDSLNCRSCTHDSELSCAVIDETCDPREPVDPPPAYRADALGLDRRSARVYERQPGGDPCLRSSGLCQPQELRLDESLVALLSEADRALGRLDGAVGVLPDPDLFVLQYVRREAVLSSQIEGTHASLMDVLEFEAEMERAERRVDVAEIINYVGAMNHGLARLAELPLSRRLLCEVHAKLMEGVRGGEPHNTPGEVRRSQNWIGGGSPATARFVPPPPELVSDAFANLENYLHDPEPVPPLLKAGIAHAQFETIHPFLDGNGRTERLLITFWPTEQGVLRRPLLYTSLYFKDHRDDYIDRLQAIRDDGDWEGWLAFFLDGVARWPPRPPRRRPGSRTYESGIGPGSVPVSADAPPRRSPCSISCSGSPWCP